MRDARLHETILRHTSIALPAKAHAIQRTYNRAVGEFLPVVLIFTPTCAVRTRSEQRGSTDLVWKQTSITSVGRQRMEYVYQRKQGNW